MLEIDWWTRAAWRAAHTCFQTALTLRRLVVLGRKYKNVGYLAQRRADQALPRSRSRPWRSHSNGEQRCTSRSAKTSATANHGISTLLGSGLPKSQAAKKCTLKPSEPPSPQTMQVRLAGRSRHLLAIRVAPASPTVKIRPSPLTGRIKTPILMNHPEVPRPTTWDMMRQVGTDTDHFNCPVKLDPKVRLFGFVR